MVSLYFAIEAEQAARKHLNRMEAAGVAPMYRKPCFISERFFIASVEM
jgi:hypothetical protein